ncbi:MAG: arsenic metallochaperone ArsD family protein [Desulfovibrionales bacterium]
MARWHLEIFVPFLPCGCRPDLVLDPDTAAFQQTLLELKEVHKGELSLQIFALNQHLQQFRKYPEIVDLLQNVGKRGLPVVACNGQIIFKGSFPKREELETGLQEL